LILRFFESQVKLQNQNPGWYYRVSYQRWKQWCHRRCINFLWHYWTKEFRKFIEKGLRRDNEKNYDQDFSS